MVKKEELKSLTYKYFWQQKKEELQEFLVGFAIIYLVAGLVISAVAIPFGVFDYSCPSYIDKCSSNGFHPLWFIPSILWIIDVLVLVIWKFVEWIKNNWEYATRRAKDDLRRKRK